MRIRPEPNAHLALFVVAETLHPYIENRPVTVIDLGVALLLLGDEPVLVFGDDERRHLRECFLTDAQRRRAARRAVKAGREHSEPLHVYPTRETGLALASGLALPIATDRVLWWGPPRTDAPSHVQLAGDAAADVVRELNDLTVRNAYLWLAARPDHPSIRTMDLPERTPVLQICDGVPAASAAITVIPGMPQRLRKPPGGAR